MQFETQRLILRPWQPATDANHATDIYGDTRVMEWIDLHGKDASIRQVQSRLQRYLDNTGTSITGSWAVEQKDIGRVIGHVLLMPLPDLQNTKPQTNSWADLKQDPDDKLEVQYPDGIEIECIEIGWHFRPASWGFGYATEAARELVQYAFEQLKLPMLIAVTDPDNPRSAAVIERLGMRYDGLTTRYYGGKPLDLYMLSAENYRLQSVPNQDESGPVMRVAEQVTFS